MTRRTLVLFACFSLLFIAGNSEGQTFVFHMRGDQEVPPVPSANSGGCMGQLNQPSSQFTLTCVHDVIGATTIHIHRGAAGVNGSVAFDMGDPTSPVTATWTSMTPADIADLLAGDLYINVHSAGRPAGEIRGQILSRTVDTVPFTATGDQYIPPNTTAATATCTADLSADATQLSVSCTHDVPAPVSAHIHEAPFGQNGPSVFTFASPASPLAGNMTMTAQLVADYAATFLYLDIHSGSGSEDTASPQIRGQIGEPPAPPSTGTIRIVKQTAPGGGTGFTFTENVTPGTFTLDDTEVQTFSAVAAGTYTISEDDPSASNYSLADVSCDDANSTGDSSTRAATVRLEAGEVVTCTFRNVLVSPTSSIFVFHMSGDQEVPAVTTDARGGCFGQFDAGSSTLTLVCAHSVVGPTIMHVHRGAAGANGAVAFDMGDPTSPAIATWAGMTPADVADLLAENLYINIHTAGRPAGEIRGQIRTRTVDTVNFTADASQYVPPGSSTATATCSADLDNPASTLAVQCTHDLPSPDVAHVHEGAFGTTGPEVFAFASAASPISGNVPMTPRLVAHYAGSLLYLDIHGTGGGEETGSDAIRGQIGVIPTGPVPVGTIRIVKQSSPSGGTGFTFTENTTGSTSTFTLDDGGVGTFSGIPAATYTITENLMPGYTLSGISCDDADSVEDPFARTATVNLQALEVVTCTFENLQTVAASSIFVFHMSGDQEVPPVATGARGGCFGQFNAASSALAIVCTHDVTGPAIAHIHRGAPGVNGSIAFDLGDPNSPIQATWTGMTPTDVADLLAGNLYVNIHASGRPAGEIRGQILERTVDTFGFPVTGAQEVPPTDSPAIGNCTADLATDATSVLVQCDHNVAAPTGTHLHDAPPGQEGPIVFTFPNTDPFSGNAPLTPRLVADFAAGFLYVNIHSADFPDGEIRGQLIAGAPAVGAVAIPTLSEWLAMLLALALVGLGAWRLR